MSYLRRNIIFLALSVGQNILQYIVQIVLGRLLTSTQFGAFNSLFSFSAIFGTTGTIVAYLTSTLYLKNERSEEARSEFIGFMFFFYSQARRFSSFSGTLPYQASPII